VPLRPLKTRSDNNLSREKNFRFTTWDKTPPTLTGSNPVNDATGVPVNKDITVTFSEKIQQGAAYDSIILKDDQGNTVAIRKNVRKDKLIIIPNTRLGFNTRYTVTVPAQAVKDMENNDIANDFTFNFTTRTRK